MFALQDLTEREMYSVIDVYIEIKEVERYLFDVYMSVQGGKLRIPLLSAFLRESQTLMFYTMLKELEQRLAIECRTEEAHRVAKEAEDLLTHGSIDSIPEMMLAEAYRQTIFGEYMRDLMIYLRKTGLTFYDDRTEREKVNELQAFRYRNEIEYRIVHHIRAPQREVW